MLYVSRAQKKAEREELLRRQFEERRKERIMKFKVVFCSIFLHVGVTIFILFLIILFK